MFSERLDRHKLASCICGAIIEIRPITGVRGQKILKTANEWLAVYTGINVIKSYMVYGLLYNHSMPQSAKFKVKEYLTNHFQLDFPPNICDTRQYNENLVNALHRTHTICKNTKTTCFQYDIWAYSKVFYHLELYNQENLYKAYKSFLQTENLL